MKRSWFHNKYLMQARSGEQTNKHVAECRWNMSVKSQFQTKPQTVKLTPNTDMQIIIQVKNPLFVSQQTLHNYSILF